MFKINQFSYKSNKEAKERGQVLENTYNNLNSEEGRKPKRKKNDRPQQSRGH